MTAAEKIRKAKAFRELTEGMTGSEKEGVLDVVFSAAQANYDEGTAWELIQTCRRTANMYR